MDMHDFVVSPKLWLIVLRVFRMKQSIWKGFGSKKPNFERFGLRLKI